MNGNRHNVFLNFYCILILTLAIKKLVKPGHLVINDFLLSLQLGCENDVTVVVTHDRHRALAKRVDINAESISIIHNSPYTPGQVRGVGQVFSASFFGTNQTAWPHGKSSGCEMDARTSARRAQSLLQAAVRQL